MARNGSGVYSLYTPGNPVVAGTTIDPVAFNNTTTDLATALTNSVARNGEGVPTANWPMAGFKLTGLANGTSAGDSLAYGQALSQFPNVAAPVTTTNTELGYVAGVTSAIQTQLAAKVTTGAVSTIVTATKAANGTRVSNNGLTDDSDLVCAVGTGTYAVKLYLPVWGSSGCGIKFTVACSGTATGQFSYVATVNGSTTALNSAGTITLGGTASIPQIFLAGPGPGGADVIVIESNAVVTAAGNLKLQWGQSITNASAMTIGAGAWMTCTRVA